MKYAKLVVTFLLLFVEADGSYLVQLTVDSYANPSNKCAECSTSNPLTGPYGCCDGFDLGFCTESERCDNYFRYCLREYGTAVQTLGCTLGGEITSNFPQESEFNRDTDFSSSRVLGLENPLTLQETNSQWQGVQLHIQVFDYDSDSNDEIIDTFSINIPSSFIPGTPDTELLQHSQTGRFNLASIRFRYRILCQQFFYGNHCQNYDACQAENIVCQNNGVCIDEENNFRCECKEGFMGQFCEDVDYCFLVNCTNRGNCQQTSTSFMCDCDAGYTGQLCETEINECIGVNCTGRGVCMDEIDLFRCLCNPGYTGNLCETEVDECEFVNCSGRGMCRDELNFFTCVCNPGYTGQLCASKIIITGTSSVAVPELVGGTIAAAVAIILVFTSVSILFYFCKQKREKKTKPSNLNDYRAYVDQHNTGCRATMTPRRYVRANSADNLSNHTNIIISLQSLADANRQESPVYESPVSTLISARNSNIRKSNISLASVISIHSGRDNPVYGAPDDGQFFTRNSYARASNMSTATAITMISRSDTRSSDDQVYSEPFHQSSIIDSNDDVDEREFQNPLYESSENITETDSILHSFVGATGVYLSKIQNNECLI